MKNNIDIRRYCIAYTKDNSNHYIIDQHSISLDNINIPKRLYGQVIDNKQFMYIETKEDLESTEKVTLNFSQAIQLLKDNKAVARVKRWGIDIHLYLENGSVFNVNAGVYKGTHRIYYPVIVLFQYKTHHPGWVPTQEDMLAEDWEIVNIN